MNANGIKTERMLVLKRVVLLMCDIRPSDAAAFLADVMHRIERSFIRSELSLRRLKRSPESRLIIRQAIYRNPNFINFTDEQKQATVDVTIPVTYTVGAYIRGYDLFENLYIIEKGEFEINQDNKVMQKLTAGDFFGSINGIPYYGRNSVALATKFSKVWNMTQSNFCHLAVDHTGWKRIKYTDSLAINFDQKDEYIQPPKNRYFAPTAPPYDSSNSSDTSCEKVEEVVARTLQQAMVTSRNKIKSERTTTSTGGERISPTQGELITGATKVDLTTLAGEMKKIEATINLKDEIGGRSRANSDAATAVEHSSISTVSDRNPSSSTGFESDILRPMPPNLFGPRNKLPMPSLLKALDKVKFPDGIIIMHQGQDSRNFYYILEGEAAVYIKDDDEQLREICRLGPKNHFGDNGFLLNRSAPSTVKAIKNLTCLRLQTYLFEQSLSEWFD